MNWNRIMLEVEIVGASYLLGGTTAAGVALLVFGIVTFFGVIS